MKNSLIFFILLISNSTLAKDYIRVESPTKLKPSSQLLELTKYKIYEVSDKVLIKSGKCLNPVLVPFTTQIDIKNVEKIVGAIETFNHKKQKQLFTLKNDGGLTPWNGYFSVQLNLVGYNSNKSNIWIFATSNGITYANAIQIPCYVSR